MPENVDNWANEPTNKELAGSAFLFCQCKIQTKPDVRPNSERGKPPAPAKLAGWLCGHEENDATFEPTTADTVGAVCRKGEGRAQIRFNTG